MRSLLDITIRATIQRFLLEEGFPYTLEYMELLHWQLPRNLRWSFCKNPYSSGSEAAIERSRARANAFMLRTYVEDEEEKEVEVGEEVEEDDLEIVCDCDEDILYDEEIAMFNAD
ncbi:hypothetical protein FE257_005708 [Aspergillus nanangensis]|uniref:Uncharacterized protein n=1 Tax=Aspergillus nanangensis TaxID=2582783 RepID=A0AAD4GV93_ASPNN|nr:hypothetical protein FE257_005708 [Aspergillus nanangensis]